MEEFSDGSKNRILSLDGWRGIAILIVLISHFVGTMKLGAAFKWIPATGPHGVTVFFVLSGFLITTTIATHRPSLKAFYTKRFFRLMPTAWAYLLFLPVAGAVFGISLIGFREALSCLFFFRNFQGQMGQGMTAHFWSLSIEEQFYFIWPPILLAVGNKRACLIAAFAALAISLNRFVHWNFYHRKYFEFRTEARADALFIGCLAALLLLDPAIRPRLERFAKFVTFPAIAIFLYCMWRYDLPPTVECAAIAILMIATLDSRSMFAAPLRHPALRWMGRTSYSFYIWSMFFALLSGPPMRTTIMMVLLCCFAVASHYLIERPGLALGVALLKSERQPRLVTGL